MKTRVIAVAGAIFLLAGAGYAQSLADRLKQGASELGDTVTSGVGAVIDGADVVTESAGQVTQSVMDTTESTLDMIEGDDTPMETRVKIDAMAAEALDRLFAEQPQAVPLFDLSAGYAVFDSRELTLGGVTAGGGRGVAVDADDLGRVYMNMATGGAGFAFGLGGFETKVIFFFETPADLRQFVENGYDASAEAGTMIGDDTTNLAMRFENGRATFVLTNRGWKLSGSVAGTRYWRSAELN